MSITKEEQQVIDKYGYLIHDTGGNNIKELIERDDINMFNNSIATSLQISVYSQVSLLTRLKAKGIIE